MLGPVLVTVVPASTAKLPALSSITVRSAATAGDTPAKASIPKTMEPANEAAPACFMLDGVVLLFALSLRLLFVIYFP